MKRQASLYCSRQDKIIETHRDSCKPKACEDYILEAKYWGSYQIDVFQKTHRTKATIRQALISEKRCLYCIHSRPLTRAIQEHLNIQNRAVPSENGTAERPQPQPINASSQASSTTSAAAPPPAGDRGPATVKNSQNEHRHTQKA